MKTNSAFRLLTAAFCAVTFNTRATTLWDTNLFGLPTNADSEAISDSAFQRQSADVFTLVAGATVQQVQWWGFYANGVPSYPDYFTIQIYPIIAGTPAATAAFSYTVGNVPRVDTGYTGIGELYSYSTDIPNTSLGAGSYLLSIVDNTYDYSISAPPMSPGWWWNVAYNFTDGQSWTRPVPLAYNSQQSPPATGDAWSLNPLASSGPLAFNITGETVPEPTSAALLLGGGTLLALRRRRSPAGA